MERIGANPGAFLVRLCLTAWQSGTFVLGLIGIWLTRSHWRMTSALAVSLLYFALVMEASNLGIQARYLVYGFPILSLFAALAVVEMFNTVRRRFPGLARGRCLRWLS